MIFTGGYEIVIILAIIMHIFNLLLISIVTINYRKEIY